MDSSSYTQQNVDAGASSSKEIESYLEVDLRYIPLFNAALRGDWDAATGFFDQDEQAITAPITKSFETALYIAVGTGERAIHFVENLVELMPVQSLIYQEIGGFTALHTAAWVGNTRAAAVLVRQNPDLLYIFDKDRKLPLHLAAENARKDTLLFLLAVTKDDHVCMPFSGDSGVRDDHVSMPFSRDSGVRLVNYAILSRFYDVALSLVQRYPELARSKDDNNNCALGSIATKASAFPSGSGLNFWQRIIYYNVPVKLGTDSIKYPSRGDIENPSISSKVIVQNHVWSIWAQLLKDFSISVPLVKHIRDQKQMHLQALTLLKCVCEEIRYSNAYISFSKEAIIIASRIGTHEVIQEIVDSFPKLVWTSDGPENQTIFQRAVIDRHENVFNLIYQMGDHKEYATKFRDIRGNNMLHLAGRLAPQNKLDQVPGAALQMQRELQWFKEVEKQVQPGYTELQNDYEETPAMVFTKEHKELLKEGQKWMKETANSCTIAAALIVTVVFAAAITVPGGNNNDTGLPMFSKKTAFITFVVSDAIAFFTSTTSLLMFLSILTSHYTESDFLHVLPQRLIIGLLTLFLSITTMVVAFSATLYLVFGHDKAWILIPVAVLASLPVTSFMSLQFPLLLDLISSTYGSGIFGKQSDRPFY